MGSLIKVVMPDYPDDVPEVTNKVHRLTADIPTPDSPLNN